MNLYILILFVLCSILLIMLYLLTLKFKGLDSRVNNLEHHITELSNAFDGLLSELHQFSEKHDITF